MNIINDRWLVTGPDGEREIYDTEADAREVFDRIVDDLRDEAGDGWHDSADDTAIYRMVEVARLELRVTAHAEDQTEDGERCRAAGWDYFAEGVVVERVKLPEEGAGWREWATAAARALDYAAKDPACTEPEWLRGAATTIRGALRSPDLGPRIQRPVSVTLVGPPLPGPPCERCQGANPDCGTCGGMGCSVYVYVPDGEG